MDRLKSLSPLRGLQVACSWVCGLTPTATGWRRFATGGIDAIPGICGLAPAATGRRRFATVRLDAISGICGLAPAATGRRRFATVRLDAISGICGLAPAATRWRRFVAKGLKGNKKSTPNTPRWFAALSIFLVSFCASAAAEDEPFRPTTGEFPPLENAHAYRGELIFVDHANRRGSIRVQGDGKFYRNDPQPFAMLPYGIVQYHGAPADLRDVPLGTVMHVRGFLPPDPKISAVPVLPVNNKDKDVGHYRGTGTAPAENHVLLLEDEPSHCLREGLTWMLKEVDIKDNAGRIIASREPKSAGDGNFEDEVMTFDAATRIWRGRERIRVADLIAEDAWPASGKKDLGQQAVLLGITWKPAPGDGLAGAFTQFHISDIWLDDAAIQNAAEFQTETHKSFIRSRWMPAMVDSVDYGEFGRATVTATLFGGMDSSLYEDFQKDVDAQINGAGNTLKHTAGHYGPGHVASSGKILEVTRATGEIPMGSSGVQIQFETDLIIEGIRQGRVVRIRPGSWPKAQIPREEYLFQNSPEDRFPNPDIFPKY